MDRNGSGAASLPRPPGRHPDADLLVVLDHAGVALVLLDGERSPLCVTTALGALLESDADAGTLLTEVRRLAGQLLRGSPAESPNVGDAPGDDPEATPKRTTSVLVTSVLTGRFEYRLVAGVLGDPRDGAALVAVVLERRTRLTLNDAAVRERHGLSPREIEVARLLASGASNVSIAMALRISPHTARRHTERVLRKLGVRSRTAVAAALSEPEPAHPPESAIRSAVDAIRGGA
jgi:DNA-binding CsgD family transcriptional regulator